MIIFIKEKVIWKNPWPKKVSDADLAGTILELWPIWSRMSFSAKFMPNTVGNLFAKHYGVPPKEAIAFFNSMIDRIFKNDAELFKALKAIPGAIQESINRGISEKFIKFLLV